MQEKDIQQAKELLRTKRNLRDTKIRIKDCGVISVLVDGYNNIDVRAGVLTELIDKEISYTNRMLKSIGIKELT